MVGIDHILSTIADYGYPCFFVYDVKGQTVARYPQKDGPEGGETFTASVPGAQDSLVKDFQRLLPGSYRINIRSKMADTKGGITRVFIVPDQHGNTSAAVSGPAMDPTPLIEAKVALVKAEYENMFAQLKRDHELAELRREMKELKAAKNEQGFLTPQVQAVIAGLAEKFLLGGSGTMPAVAGPPAEEQSPQAARVEAAILRIAQQFGEDNTAAMIEQFEQSLTRQRHAEPEQPETANPGPRRACTPACSIGKNSGQTRPRTNSDYAGKAFGSASRKAQYIFKFPVIPFFLTSSQCSSV